MVIGLPQSAYNTKIRSAYSGLCCQQAMMSSPGCRKLFETSRTVKRLASCFKLDVRLEGGWYRRAWLSESLTKYAGEGTVGLDKHLQVKRESFWSRTSDPGVANAMTCIKPKRPACLLASATGCNQMSDSFSACPCASKMACPIRQTFMTEHSCDQDIKAGLQCGIQYSFSQ